MPDDNIEPGAVSVANMKGYSKTYYWDEDGGPEFEENPYQSNIIKINLKSDRQPFALVEPPEGDGNLITSYKGHGRNSYFNWWDHWPVSQDASDGRGARSASNPSHSSLCHIGLPGNATAEWASYMESEEKVTKLMMHGMTHKKVEELVPLAKSWLNAPILRLKGSGFESRGYRETQMAYLLSRKDQISNIPLDFTIEASEDSPLVNPAFVIGSWGEAIPVLSINGEKMDPGADFRYGIEHQLDGTDLIIWIRMESSRPVTVSVKPSVD